MNNNIKIIIKSPKDCSKDEIDNFIKKVIEEGQVSTSTLKNNVRRAKYLAFCYKTNELIGTAAIKNAETFYKNNVFKKAGVGKKSQYYNLEFGYATTNEKYRNKGINRKITDKLMKLIENENIFATTSVDNIPMQKILEKNDFTSIGEPYLGEQTKKMVQLYIKPKT